MNTIKHLEPTKWVQPDSYAGHSPVGDYIIYSRNRDSSICENVNYKLILADLSKLNEKLQREEDEPFVYDFRAKHWACGWVEYIIVCKDSPSEILTLASEIICALESYPIYNDDKYSEAQAEVIYENWDNSSIQERIDYIKDNNAGSIFQSRRNIIPEKVFNSLSEVYY